MNAPPPPLLLLSLSSLLLHTRTTQSYYTCDFAAIAVLVFDPNDAAAIAVAFVKVAASAAAYL